MAVASNTTYLFQLTGDVTRPQDLRPAPDRIQLNEKLLSRLQRTLAGKLASYKADIQSHLTVPR